MLLHQETKLDRLFYSAVFIFDQTVWEGKITKKEIQRTLTNAPIYYELHVLSLAVVALCYQVFMKRDVTATINY